MGLGVLKERAGSMIHRIGIRTEDVLRGSPTVEAFPWNTAPTYGPAFTRRVRARGIRDRPISRRSPWQNAYVERLIGTLRRDCLDHVLIFHERHLRRVLTLYSLYYNETRTHFGIGQGRAARTSRPTIRDHRRHTNLVRFASSIRPDMIFGKDRGSRPGSNGSATNTVRRRLTCTVPRMMATLGWWGSMAVSSAAIAEAVSSAAIAIINIAIISQRSPSVPRCQSNSTGSNTMVSPPNNCSMKKTNPSSIHSWTTCSTAQRRLWPP